MPSLTILCENTARGAGILGEHGLSYWLDTGAHRVLFDTGQGMTLLHNAEKLGIDLARADAVVLSHGHYDHVSGLPFALEAAPRASLWFHPAATRPKFIRSASGAARRISTDFLERADFGKSRDVRRVTAPTEVVPGVWVTGEIPRSNSFEDTGGPFFLDEALRTPDPLSDDMALFLPLPDSLSVLLGCAHAGVVNTLRHILGLTGPLPVHNLIGGIHLGAASAERIESTVETFRSLSPKRIALCHCTGFRPLARFASEFPNACIEGHAGLRLELSSPPK